MDDGAGADRCWWRRRTSAGTSPASARRRRRARRGSRASSCSSGSRACCRCRRCHRHLLLKDLKIFLRDVSQWSQLLLLLALVLVYLYNFRVLDLDKIPYMSGMIKNVYAFVNLAMAGLVMSTVCARFVFPGGVGGRGGVLDHPDRADFAARVPVVEVLDRPAAGVRAHRRADGRGQLPSSASIRCCASSSAVAVFFMALAHGRARDRPRRALSAVQRREPQPGRRLVRRRGVHDPRRALHDPPDRARRLAVVRAALVPRRRTFRCTAGDRGAMVACFGDGRGDEPGDLVGRHALGRARARGDGRL